MYRMMMYPGYRYSLSPWVGIFSLVLNILFWVFLFWAIFALIKALIRHHKGKYEEEDEEDKEENSNLKIIKRRYAEGEITKKEYEQLKEDLS